jgi:hypothetical protein
MAWHGEQGAHGGCRSRRAGEAVEYAQKVLVSYLGETIGICLNVSRSSTGVQKLSGQTSLH